MSVTYPTELEACWLKVAAAETHASAVRDVLHRLRPDIVRLADRFTTGRAEAAAAPYLKDTRACAAYSLFFAPQTHARLTHILAELPPFPETVRPLRVLDLGAGTGPPRGRCWTILAGARSRSRPGTTPAPPCAAFTTSSRPCAPALAGHHPANECRPARRL